MRTTVKPTPEQEAIDREKQLLLRLHATEKNISVTDPRRSIVKQSAELTATIVELMEKRRMKNLEFMLLGSRS